MKKIILLMFFSAICTKNFAQADTSLLYLRFPILPALNLVNVTDSSKFNNASLKKHTATLIMIFSPDCEHCQHETKMLKEHIDLFKKIQIVMSSPLEYKFLKRFYNDYRIADYPNIIIGSDPGYFLGTFYHVRSFPSLFLYDKKGNFVKAFDGSVPIEQIAEAL